MLGFAHHPVPALSVLVDRKLLWTHTVIPQDPDWVLQLSAFLKMENQGRKRRIIVIDDVGFLNRLKHEGEALSGKEGHVDFNTCCILISDLPEKLLKYQDIKIVDAKFENDVWKFHKLTPPVLNETILAADAGISLTTSPVVASTPVLIDESTLPNVEFDPKDTLFFQMIENCLASCSSEHQRKILRQLIAAWFEGGLSPDYGERIMKRIQKYGGDLSTYKALTVKGEKLGYVSGLNKASHAAASVLTGKKDPNAVLKDVAGQHGVRVGDLKWLNQNWPFSNLLSPSPESHKEV